MKKLFNVLAVIATVLLASAFISCSNPSTPSNSGGNSGGHSGNSTVVDENEPFAGSTWVAEQDMGGGVTVKYTVKFPKSGTVDYFTTTAGTTTSIYSGSYTVEKNFGGVEGQYGARFRAYTFTIQNKNATTAKLFEDPSITYTKQLSLSRRLQ